MAKWFRYVLLVVILGAVLVALLVLLRREETEEPVPSLSPDSIALPEPRVDSEISVEATLNNRRSVREYSDAPLTLSEVGQLLWAAQGITGDNQRYRAAPSAGALYPLELYVAAGNVEDLTSGVYRYRPQSHALIPVVEGDAGAALARAALGQAWIEDGAVVLAFAAVYERTTQKYGARGRQYVHMEVGHAAQNVYLQAEALGLGTVTVGAFDEGEVRRATGMANDEVPLYLMPVGRLP
ncbi:MAG: SagB/ThcOx family dehydrogenase, partial [Anaerolineales bacterium]